MTTNYPIYKYDNQGNVIYFEDSYGYWSKWNYDNQGNPIYYEGSSGFWRKGFRSKKTKQKEGVYIKGNKQ